MGQLVSRKYRSPYSGRAAARHPHLAHRGRAAARGRRSLALDGDRLLTPRLGARWPWSAPRPLLVGGTMLASCARPLRARPPRAPGGPAAGAPAGPPLGRPTPAAAGKITT